MAALPYMQLYVADYLADTLYLDVIESGAYLHLLMNYWQTGKPLPNDDKKLARISKCTEEQWLNVRSTVVAYFVEQNNELMHERVERDLAKVREKSNAAKLAGKKSGESRRNKRKANDRSNECTNDRSTSVANPLQRKANHTDPDTETDPETDNFKKNADSDESATVEPSKPGDPWEEHFERFWHAFDHKQGRKPALKAWMTIPKRARNLDTILHAAHAEAQRRKLQPDKTPKWAQGWLNEQRWLDEIYTQPQTTHNPALAQAQRIVAKRQERERRRAQVVNE